MKPCIVRYSRLHQRFEAFDEFGRMICHSIVRDVLFDILQSYSVPFEQVSLNSRLGRTILDKVEHQFLQ